MRQGQQSRGERESGQCITHFDTRPRSGDSFQRSLRRRESRASGGNHGYRRTDAGGRLEMTRLLIIGAIVFISACAAGTASTSAQEGGLAPISDDTIGRANVPVGFGTLRQDDIAIRLELQG